MATYFSDSLTCHEYFAEASFSVQCPPCSVECPPVLSGSSQSVLSEYFRFSSDACIENSAAISDFSLPTQMPSVSQERQAPALPVGSCFSSCNVSTVGTAETACVI